jgi:hypothetical protein
MIILFDFSYYCIFCGHYSDDGDTLNKICFECEETEAAQEFYKKEKAAAATKGIQNKNLTLENYKTNLNKKFGKEAYKK